MIKKLFSKDYWIIKRSGLFDAEYYLRTYPDIREADVDPMWHYCVYGWREGRNPSGRFDTGYYLSTYQDVCDAGVNPLVHYVRYGKMEGRRPLQNSEQINQKESYFARRKNTVKKILTLIRNNPKLIAKFMTEVKANGLKYAIGKMQGKMHKEFGMLNNLLPDIDGGNIFASFDHEPLVSILSVNYNGQNDLPNFLESIRRQTYKNFELIIVDNASSDDSKEIIRQAVLKSNNIKLIEAEHNMGFAEGNNLAMEYATGEYFALINIDTKLDIDWLRELVEAIRVDASAAAVTSKTLFYERFQVLTIACDFDFKISMPSLIESLNYKKYFLRTGYLNNDILFSQNCKISIDIPIQENKILLKTFTDDVALHDKVCRIAIGRQKAKNIAFKELANGMEIDFSVMACLNSFEIVNNAGSIADSYGMPQDRGFGERDIGQYDAKCYIHFFCGCSVLLRRIAMLDRKIFVSEFFAYYEDSELSKWLIDKGYSILYAPRSVVRHRHSATSSEGSSQWLLMVQRSNAIYSYGLSGDIENLKNTLYKLENEYSSVNAKLFEILCKYNEKLLHRLSNETRLVEKEKAICVYNSYWNTKGGGESHALSIASVLQGYGKVYLLSETDFDIQELSSYFDIDLSRCIKLVISQITPEITKNFSLFINSTYCSNLISYADRSWYIVYFPHKSATKELFKNYTFLYISEYVKEWAKIYWNDVLETNLLYPIGMLDADCADSHSKKSKVILSVGRFFTGHHCKNQLDIAKAFKQLMRVDEGLKDWKLIFIGSLDESNSEHLAYYLKVKKELDGVNAEIIINCDRVVLNSYYDNAAIYVHASGMNVNADVNPENIEHFGITPIEAMLHGCFPIVYYIGGPANTIAELDVGATFSTQNTLVEILSKSCNKFSNGHLDGILIKNVTTEFVKHNLIEKRIDKLMLCNKDAC